MTAAAVRNGSLILVAVVVAVAVGWAVASSSDARRRSVPWKNITASVGPVVFAGFEQHRFRKSRDFRRFIRSHETERLSPVPFVDFSRDEVELLAVGPRSSTGYSLSVRQVYESAGQIVVVVDEHAPGLGSRTRATLAFPFVAISLPRSDEPVVVDWPQHP